MKPRVYLLRFGVGWAEWVWELPQMRVSGFDTMADAADDARAWVHMNGLIERSSFGGPEAAAARETVSDEKARDLVERSEYGPRPEHTNGSTT